MASSLLRGRGIEVVAFAAALLLAQATPASADGGVEVRLEPSVGEITVGDPVLLTLEVVHPPGSQAIIPRLPKRWGVFEVRVQSAAVTESDSDSDLTTQTIEVTLFAPGRFETPELPVNVRDTEGNIVEFFAPTVSLTVASVLNEGDTELRNIKPQADVDVPPLWPWFALAAVLASLAAAAAYLLFRRSAELPGAAVAFADTRPPYQIAMDELDRIERWDLPAEGRLKEHSILVTDCQRRYLEDAHHIPAVDRTNSEIRAGLRQSQVPRDLAELTVSLLDDCDLVKFAKLEPDREVVRGFATRARDLVHSTRPIDANQAADQLGAVPAPGSAG